MYSFDDLSTSVIVNNILKNLSTLDSDFAEKEKEIFEKAKEEKHKKLKKELGAEVYDIEFNSREIDVKDLSENIKTILENQYEQLKELGLKKKDGITLNDVRKDLGEKVYKKIITNARYDRYLERLGENRYKKIEEEAKASGIDIVSKVKSIIGSEQCCNINTSNISSELYKALGMKEQEGVSKTVKRVDGEFSKIVNTKITDAIDSDLKELLNVKLNWFNDYLRKNYGNSIKNQKFLKKSLCKLLRLKTSGQQPINFKELITAMNEKDLGSLIDLIYCCCNDNKNLSSYKIGSLYDRNMRYYRSQNENFIKSVMHFAEEKFGIDFKNPKESILKKLGSMVPGSDKKNNNKPDTSDNLVIDFTSSLLTPSFSPFMVVSVFSVASLIGLSSIIAPLIPAVIAIYSGFKVRGLISSDDGKEGTIHNHFSKDDYVNLFIKNNNKVNFQDIVNHSRKIDNDKENSQSRSM